VLPVAVLACNIWEEGGTASWRAR